MRSPTFMALAAFAAASIAVSGAASAASENWRARSSAEDEVSSNDVAAEVAFGREISARILGRYKTYKDAKLTKYVSLVGLALTRNTNRPELEYHFTILDSDEVNAFAAPGGYVFITKGALLLMKDEAELAGVLAHEIEHIAEMHVVKDLKIKGADDSATSGLARLAGGSTESARAAFSQAIDKGFEMVFKDAYKRSDELQSDRGAVIVCALSGYDASALARYLARVRTVKGEVAETGTVTEQTHPSFAVRIAQINSVITSDGVDISGLATNQKRFDMAMNIAMPKGRRWAGD
ncbi:MAG TPA: M48 family metalloprotease [Sideroxyarcus sp.]|nr:M48 family metalloprotease [Sideroxyarcus sp.]